MTEPHTVDAYWQPHHPLCAGCWQEMPDDSPTSVCPDCVRESEEESFAAAMPLERHQHPEDEWRFKAA